MQSNLTGFLVSETMDIPETTKCIAFRLDEPQLMPTRANPTDAGLDLYSKESVVLEKGKRVLVDTGVRAAIPANHVGLLVSRSSLSKKHIVLINSVGIIDSDYRGNIMAALMNIGPNDVEYIYKNDKFVQLVIVPIALLSPVLWQGSEEDWNTKRGTGGFGSTGN